MADLSRASSPKVQSLERALDLLEHLSSSEELSLSDLATRAHLVPSTAHRLLATLVDRGYATQGPNRLYQVGPKVFELAGARRDPTARLRSVARPHLRAIQEEIGETCNLVILDGIDAIFIDQVEGTHTLRMLAEIGSSAPAHATGAGKAILAFTPPDDVAALYRTTPELRKLTVRTITTFDALEEEFTRIRHRGYAIDDEERETGCTCIAAAILDDGGVARAALSISGPTPRFLHADITDIAALLRHHAAAVSSALYPIDPADEELKTVSSDPQPATA